MLHRNALSRSAPRGRLLVVAGRGLGVVGLCVFFLALGIASIRTHGESLGEGVVAFGVAAGIGGAVAGFLTVVGAAFSALGRRHLAAGAEALMRRDERPPVLYLRPFTLDPVAGEVRVRQPFMSRGHTEEEEIVDAFAAIGPVIAIGRPGEELPPTGAARMYVSMADWQRVVLDLMARARLVVLGGAYGEGFLWELRHAVARVPPSALVLLIPFEPGPYEEFRRMAGPLFPRSLPDYPPLRARVQRQITGVVYFADDWTGYFLRLDATTDSRPAVVLGPLIAHVRGIVGD
ncbi:hypothetical protein [Virgisporangium aurantiacum]|nr:hypothetical protein [Virgisporangium aurantiacum]